MEDTFALELTILIFLLVLSRTLYVIHKITTGHTKTAQKARTRSAKALICIGSGGHTTEMLALVKTLDVSKYSPRYYVMADTDTTSRSKVAQSEQDSLDHRIVTIPRSRVVNQSYVTSVLTTLWATARCVPLVCKVAPDVILCNGPGTCVPVCVVALALKVAFVRDTRIVFVESFCRTKTFSLTGKILAYIADNVLVQWPTLKAKLKRSDYIDSTTKMESGDSRNGNGDVGVNESPPDEGDALGNARFAKPNVVAHMPTDRNSRYYKMDHQKRGLAVIFNHEYFKIPGLKARSGTQVDCGNFEERLKKLHFDVVTYHDLERQEILDKLEEISKLDHSDHDCFILTVLTHGEMGVLYAKDNSYKPDSLWYRFTADQVPTLAVSKAVRKQTAKMCQFRKDCHHNTTTKSVKKKMFVSTAFVIAFAIHVAYADETCIRPKAIVDDEEQCLDGTTTFLERVQHRATGIFNLAKKKLGVDPEAENEPLKCDYYSCVFQQMIVTDEANVLEKDKLKTWISNNVPSVYKKELVAHADDCFEKFRKTETYLSIEDAKQRSCEESMEMMKCLHLYKCSIFKYP